MINLFFFIKIKPPDLYKTDSHPIQIQQISSQMLINVDTLQINPKFKPKFYL